MEFSGMFALLAVQLRATDADEATMRGYYAALKDLEPEFLQMAAQRMSLSAEWFPKSSEWRVMARTIEHERTADLKARLRKLPTPLCRACDDTGWTPTGEPPRYRVCECQSMRRLEILGRRPLPALPDASPIVDEPQAIARIDRLIAGAVKAL
jgi:hypothetical protein